jgi:hypothetical protein
MPPHTQFTGAAKRAAASAALMLVVAGCGTGTDRGQVRAAAQRFSDAVAQNRGAVACAQLSPDLRAQLVKDESSTCSKAVLALKLRGRRAAEIRVYATSAMVRLASGDTMFLGDTAEGWRLEAIGCRRQRGAPYDCEEQS